MGCAPRRCIGLTRVDAHDGLRECIPRGTDSTVRACTPSDPTVRVRDPVEHPGVPFAFVAFVAFVATSDDALDALSDGALLDEAAAHASAAFEAHQRTLHRSPH